MRPVSSHFLKSVFKVTRRFVSMRGNQNASRTRTVVNGTGDNG
jgi:hypothetical protein